MVYLVVGVNVYQDVLELDVFLCEARDPRLFFMRTSRRKQLRKAIVNMWTKQGKITTDRSSARVIAKETGFPYLLLIQIIMKLIIWWIENRRRSDRANNYLSLLGD